LQVATLTVRKVPDDVHRALRVRAARQGRSTEAEVREILRHAVKPGGRILLGSLLAKIGRELGGVDLDIARDKTPARPMKFR
jgi:plasmid stability protein